MLALFIFNSVWGLQQFLIYRQGDVFDNAVLIERGQVTQEDEGKAAVATGKLQVAQTVTDGDYRVSADCFVLVRTVEMMQNVISGDTVITDYCDYPVGNIVGDGGERYENPPFPERRNTIWFGSATFGNGTLRLGQGFTEMLYDTARENGSMTVITPEVVPHGFTLCEDGSLVSGDPDNPAVGDVRITYTALMPGYVDRVLAAGVVENGILVKTTAHLSQITQQTESFAEYKESVYGSYRSAALGFVMFAVVSAILFVVFLLKSKRASFNVKPAKTKKRVLSLLLIMLLLTSCGLRAFADFGDYGGDSDYGYDSNDSYDYDYDSDDYDYDYDDDDDDYDYDYGGYGYEIYNAYYSYEPNEDDSYYGGYCMRDAGGNTIQKACYEKPDNTYTGLVGGAFFVSVAVVVAAIIL